MKKIIKLTESDLEQIVKKVLIEQRAVPTSLRGQKGDDVKKIQQALKLKGYNLGTTGPNGDGIDGDFGPSTQRAIKDFQTKSKLRPTGSVDQQTRNYLFAGFANSQFLSTLPGKTDLQKSTGSKTTAAKTSTTTKTGASLSNAVKNINAGKNTKPQPKQGDGFFTSMVNKVKNAVSEVQDFFALPLHIRAFMKFTGLNKKPFTLNDLTKDEQLAIKQMLSYAEKKGMIKNGKIVNFYGIANALNNGSEQINFKDKKSLGLDQGNIKSQYTRVAMTLGNAAVSKSGSNYVIKDTYDFNNFINNPEKYTLAQTPTTVANALKNIGTGNYVQGVEELASYYQKLGYPGYPVDIVV
jgi:hypothetical protein